MGRSRAATGIRSAADAGTATTRAASEALKPFTRLDAARNQNQGQEGVGLGLSIAADIARAHGGQLRLVEGQRLGGLRAEIVIPR